MQTRHGVSEFISVVMTVAIAVVAIGLALNIGMPQITDVEDTAAIEHNINVLQRIDTAVKEVAQQPRFGAQTIGITFRRGQYQFDNESGEFYYTLKTNSPMIGTHATQFFGPVRVSANADVSVANATIDGIPCYLMENDHLRACIKNIQEGNTVRTNETLVQLYNKDENTVFNGTLVTQINGTNTSMTGTGYTTPKETGASLSRGRVTAHLDTSEGTYNITYSLPSGADFLSVETHGTTIASSTNSLSFVLEDSASDTVYIDGQQRGDGVYTNNDIDFGYGVSEGNQLMSGVIAGDGFESVGYDRTVQNGRYELNVTSSGESTTLIPFSTGSMGDVEERQRILTRGGTSQFFSYPAPNFAFGLSEEKTVRAGISYDSIAFQGPEQTLTKGTYTLFIENNGVTNGKPNVTLRVK